MKIVSLNRGGKNIGGIYYLSSKTRFNLYTTISEWVIENKIKSVAGPVSSGTVMAEGIASICAISNNFIDTVSIPKRYYQRLGYDNSIKGGNRKPILIIDDVLSSGGTIEHAIKKYLECFVSDKLNNHLKFIEKEKIYIMFSSINKDNGDEWLERKPRIRKLVELGKVFRIVK